MTSYNLKTLWGMLLTLISILVFQDGEDEVYKVKYYKELKKECLEWLSRRKPILNLLMPLLKYSRSIVDCEDFPRKPEFSKILKTYNKHNQYQPFSLCLFC